VNNLARAGIRDRRLWIIGLINVGLEDRSRNQGEEPWNRECPQQLLMRLSEESSTRKLGRQDLRQEKIGNFLFEVFTRII